MSNARTWHVAKRRMTDEERARAEDPANRKLARQRANDVRRHKMSAERHDALMADADMALVELAMSYDPERANGMPFRVYVWCVLPRKLFDISRREKQNGESRPAAHTDGWVRPNTVSLSAAAYDEQNAAPSNAPVRVSLADLIEAPMTADPVEAVDYEDLIEALCRKLTGAERSVVRSVFLDADKATLKAAGSAAGVTESNACQTLVSIRRYIAELEEQWTRSGRTWML